MVPFELLIRNITNCQLCKDKLPHGVRPVLQVDPRAKVLIAGQAPGIKVHQSGIPFDDASGQRLRQWLGVGDSTFYDATKIAILPMGFCYPGTGKSGDLAPIPLCAQIWRDDIMAQLNNVELTIVLGQYAQRYHMGNPKMNVTQRVQAWQDSWPHMIALPHPSGRNNIWLKRNPWFVDDVVPMLQQRVASILTP